MTTVFLLSPAFCGGRRASILLNTRSQAVTALEFRSGRMSLGRAFAFMSGLYFRGKLTYAERFGEPLVIAPGWGLVPPRRTVTHAELAAIARVGVDANDARFTDPLARDASALALARSPETRIVLLGSIATGKYVDVLDRVFGERLLFPSDFVGRGDMSRGGLLLRAARGGEELPYRPIAGAARRGPRPPRLARVR